MVANTATLDEVEHVTSEAGQCIVFTTSSTNKRLAKKGFEGEKAQRSKTKIKNTSKDNLGRNAQGKADKYGNSEEGTNCKRT